VTMACRRRKPSLAYRDISDNFGEDERQQQRTYESSQE
jgi:hypothetical protein